MAIAFSQTARLQALHRRYNESEVPFAIPGMPECSMRLLLIIFDARSQTAPQESTFGPEPYHDYEQEEQLEQLRRVTARRQRQRFKAERMAARISTRLLQDEEVEEAVAVYEAAERENNLNRGYSTQGGALKKVFGIGEHDGKIPSSRLVHPHSPFHLFWTSLTAMFLLYTAIVVPAVISFHWTDEECVAVPTLAFDCVLDTFFLVCF